MWVDYWEGAKDIFPPTAPPPSSYAYEMLNVLCSSVEFVVIVWLG